MGACFEVYKVMGSGFLEAVYQECLAREFTDRGIPYLEQPRLQLQYKRSPLEQAYQPDFLCFDKIIVEIKAVKNLLDEHRAQAVNYLRVTGKELALLVSFGHFPKLEYERFVNQSVSRLSRLS
jgi:GxxExxY protein